MEREALRSQKAQLDDAIRVMCERLVHSKSPAHRAMRLRDIAAAEKRSVELDARIKAP